MPYRLRLSHIALLSVLACNSGAILAAQYTASTSLDVKHNDNVLRVDKDSAQADSVVVPAIKLGAMLSVGQHAWINQLSVSTLRYAALSELDHSEYDFASGLNWQSGSRLTGSVGIRGAQRQSNYFSDGITPAPGLNLQKTKSIYANAQYGRLNELVVGLFADWQWLDSGVVGRRDQLQQSTLGGRVNWSVTQRISGSLECSGISTTRKGLAEVSGSYSRCELTAGMAVLKSGTSQLDVKLGQTQVSNQAGSNGGWSGSAQGSWMPTGKLRFTGAMSRTFGNSSDSMVATTENGTALNLSTLGTTVDERISLGAEWTPWTQFVNRINFSQSRRTAENTVSVLDFSSSTVSEDRVRILRMEMNYSFTRHLSTALTWEGERRVPQEGSLSSAYDVKTLAAQIKYQFR